MKFLLALIQLFNLSDGVIALLTAGAFWKLRSSRDPDRRTLLGVGLAIFFWGFAVVRFYEWTVFIYYREVIKQCFEVIPIEYRVNTVLAGFVKTFGLWCAWFVATNGQGNQSGLIRRVTSRLLDKLR